MIENEKQYEITKVALGQLTAALIGPKGVFRESAFLSVDPLFEAERRAVRAKIDDLASQLAEWEGRKRAVERGGAEMAALRAEKDMLQNQLDEVNAEIAAGKPSH